MSDERGRYWIVERAGSIPGHPDGPIPVQPGDIVIVHVVKSWSEVARVLEARGKAR